MVLVRTVFSATWEADDGMALEDMHGKDGNFPQIDIWV